MGNCYCLCAVNHPEDRGICTIEATAELRFSQFPEDSPLSVFKHVDVQMCEPCRVATLKTKGDKK